MFSLLTLVIDMVIQTQSTHIAIFSTLECGVASRMEEFAQVF